MPQPHDVELVDELLEVAFPGATVNPAWDGTCDWCGGEADNHEDDLGCHCTFCPHCGDPVETAGLTAHPACQADFDEDEYGEYDPSWDDDYEYVPPRPIEDLDTGDLT